MTMCDNVWERKELQSAVWTLEWNADSVASELRQIETFTPLQFTPSESFQTKVAMLSARMQRIAEEIAQLDPDGENV
jgi:hypothetical protein